MTDTAFLDAIDTAIAAHAAWRNQLMTDLEHTHRALDAEKIGNSSDCALGAWLSDPDLDPALRTSEPWSLAHWLHGEVHDLGREVVLLARDGRRFEADQLAQRQFLSVSNILVHVLAEWRAELAGTGESRLFGS